MPNGLKIALIILIALIFVKHPALLNQLVSALTSFVNGLGGGH